MPKSAFEKRIDELCEAQGGITHHELAERSAVVTGEALRKWCKQAASGKEFPGQVEKVALLVRYYGKTLDWLYGFDGGGPVPATDDTHAMASDAAAALVEVHGVGREQAWALMDGISPRRRTALGYFIEAHRRLLPGPPGLDADGKDTFRRKAKKLGKRR